MKEDPHEGIENKSYEDIDEYDPEHENAYKSNIQMETLPPVNNNTTFGNNATFKQKATRYTKITLKFLVHILVGAYFGYATYHYIDNDKNECPYKYNDLCGIKFCHGYGLLVLIAGFVYIGLFYYYVFKPKLGNALHRQYLGPFNTWWMRVSRTTMVSSILMGILVVALAVFLYFQTKDKPEKLRGLVGPAVFILCGYVFSSNRKAIKWRLVVTGITCQFILGIICIRWTVGQQIFQCLGNKTADFLAFTNDGSRFVYGDEIIDNGIFAFAILSVIFFFSFFISILYYIGAMQWFLIRLGWILQQMLGTTVCESVNAAANIFLGMSESPLLIRPYIKKLTPSEIHSIMVSGFATVSGTVLAAYLSFGASPALLITSSVMAAPASLAISKLYMPETERSQTSSDNIELEKSEDNSILDAASNGANNAVPIVLGIIANIIAFVAFIAFLNAVVNWLGFLVGANDIDFEWLFSKLFIPLTWVMGVPTEDCEIVAKVVATKTIINEFVAYQRLGEYTRNEDIMPRSTGIATFAICGFANPSSLGILIGSLGAMAPKRRGLIASVAFRAFIVGSIVCFTSASFAGILMEDDMVVSSQPNILLERKNDTIDFSAQDN